MARAGGQIFRDVLRRKMQGGDPNMEAGSGRHRYEDSSDAIDRVTVARPGWSRDGAGREWEDESGGFPYTYEEQGIFNRHRANSEGEPDADNFVGPSDGDADNSPIAQRLLQAGKNAPENTDIGIVNAVFEEAVKAASEGASMEDLMAAAPAIMDGYAISDENEARQLLQDAYTQGSAKAKNQMNKNMGRPFR